MTPNQANGMPEYFFEEPEGFPHYSDPRASNHCGNPYRNQVAMRQAELAARNKVSKKRVADLANEVLSYFGIEPVANPIVSIDPSLIKDDGVIDFDYDAIAEQYDLDDRRDVVNIRFDSMGDPVLVAVSDDVNVNSIPPSEEAFSERDEKGYWKYTTASIILASLNRDWDRDSLILLPLKKLGNTSFSRHDIEKAIGQHLLHSQVNLLDKFSHAY